MAPTPATEFARRFPDYPYADDCDGCLATVAGDCGPCFGKSWSGRVQFELGSDFDGLDRRGVSFLLEGTFGFGVDFDWDSYREDLAGGGHDELHLGQVNLMYRIAESDRALVRAGIGVGWLGDSYGSEAGVNFTLQADLFPRRPWVLSGELDFGTIGDAETLHAVGSLGVMLGRAEIYGGYDYREISDVALQGPVIGLRIWF